MAKMYINNGYGRNGKGKFKMSNVDMFELARVFKVKYENEGANGARQRKLNLDAVKKIVEAIRNDSVFGLWFPIIGFDDTIVIHSDVNGMQYVEIPDDPEELKEFAKHIHLIDGQHRVWAFTDEYKLRDIMDSFIVSACVMFNPSTEEMIKAFLELNSKGRPMDKNLLINFRAQIGDLKPQQKRMYDLLKMLDEDENSPLHNRINWGESAGYSAKTIIEVACGISEQQNKKCLLTMMETHGYKSIDAQYKVLLKYLNAVNVVEKLSDSTLGDPKARPLNNQQIAYIFHMCGQSLGMIKRENERANSSVSKKNFTKMYKFILREAMDAKHLSGTNHNIMHEMMGIGDIRHESYNRWGGRANVNKAIRVDSQWVNKIFNQIVEDNKMEVR